MTTKEETHETGLKFVTRPDDITLDDDPDTMRVEMLCGHAVTSESLTAYCRSKLDQNVYRFYCPALTTGTKGCGAEWPYTEVRRIALLSEEETEQFEKTIASLAAAKYCEYKSCPGCESFVERRNLGNLNVRCTVCTADKQSAYDFCWQCLKPWKGLAPRSDRCDNGGCTNKDLQLLKNCPLASFISVKEVTACPSIRACPTCGMLVEHAGTGCKNIMCKRCWKEFCFVCLKLTAECKKASFRDYYGKCSDGIAPRQTSIPSWSRT